MDTDSEQTRGWATAQGPVRGEPLDLAAQEHAARLLVGLRQEARAQIPANATRVGRYTVLRMLGSGGMGVVLSAYDEELDRRIALKLLRPDRRGDSSHGRARMLREAQALARLSHPNVIHVYEVGQYEDQVFLAMEYVPGDTLRRWLKQKPRGWREVVDMFVQAGRGLSAAHAVGLVHRDFKPDNVLVGTDGRARVLDFGLVRTNVEPVPASGEPAASAPAVAPDGDQGPLSDALTRVGTALGTPAYMAPEQHRIEPVDARADQFSFCVALHEALYGERPFPGRDALSLLASIEDGVMNDPPQGARVPAWLRRVVLRGLRTYAADRHATMDDLLRALQRDPGQRWYRVAATAAVALAVGVGGYALAHWRADRGALCSGGEQRLAGVWDPPRRAAVEAALLATGQAYAGETWTRVSAGLDQYAHEWAAMHRDACEATNLRGEQSPALLDLRMHCLDERRVELSALVDVLAAADSDVVANAAQAVSKLDPLARCADTRRLTEALPGPDPAVAAAVQTQQEALARARAEQLAGHNRQAQRTANAVVTHAQTLGYRPLLVEARVIEGRALRNLTEYAAAEASLLAALDEAEAIGHVQLAADAALERLILAQFPHAGTDAELAEVHHVRALVERSGSQALAGKLEGTLGHILLRQGKYADAEPAFRRALALLADDDPVVLVMYTGLGSALNLLGRHDEAMTIFVHVLELARTLLGPDHPNVGGILNDMANVHLARRDYAAALPIYQQALALTERSMGPDHPITLNATVNIGLVYYNQRKFREAEPLLHNHYVHMERLHGPDHLYTVRSAAYLAGVLNQLGRPDEAIPLLERAIAGLESIDPNHPELGEPLLERARLHRTRREFVPAQALLDRALAILEPRFGPDHWVVATVHVELGALALAQGRLDDAEARFRRALALLDAAGDEYVDTRGAALLGLGEVLLDRGNPVGALPDLERARAQLAASPSTSPALLAWTDYLLARARFESTHDPAALAQVRAAVATLTTERDPYLPEHPEAAAWLAQHDK